MFYFHPYLGKIPILTNIFQMGWNHQLVYQLINISIHFPSNKWDKNPNGLERVWVSKLSGWFLSPSDEVTSIFPRGDADFGGDVAREDVGV